MKPYHCLRHIKRVHYIPIGNIRKAKTTHKEEIVQFSTFRTWYYQKMQLQIMQSQVLKAQTLLNSPKVKEITQNRKAQSINWQQQNDFILTFFCRLVRLPHSQLFAYLKNICLQPKTPQSRFLLYPLYIISKHSEYPADETGTKQKTSYFQIIDPTLYNKAKFNWLQYQIQVLSIRQLFSIFIINSLMFFLLLIQLSQTQFLYPTGLYQLGDNLIQNSQFALPALASGLSNNPFSSSIDSWDCNACCEVSNITRICQLLRKNCTIPYGQAVDLDSNRRFDKISQIVRLQEDSQILFSLTWTPPPQAAIGKKFKVEVNSSTIIDITITTSSLTTFNEQCYLNLTAGATNVSMQMYGYNPDSWGVLISKVSIQKLVPNQEVELVERAISSIILNNGTYLINSIPGNRIFFSSLTQFLLVFDRIQFYYYHLQNNTLYSYVFMSNVNQMIEAKGSFPQIVIQSCSNFSQICSGTYNFYLTLLQQLNQKINYSSQDFLSKNPNGIGFLANNLGFFYFRLPFIIVNFAFFWLLFTLLFNFRISIYLKKYSLMGLMMFILYQGNCEQFSYYFFAELNLFFSANFVHKLSNIFIVYFFFFTIVVSIGGTLLLKYLYRKEVKLFIHYYSPSLAALLYEAGQRMFFPIVLGSIHFLANHNPTLQSILLSSVELAYIFMRILCLKTVKVKLKSKISLTLIQSLLRISFIGSFYIFESTGSQIINRVHRDIIILYIFNWIFCAVIQVGELIRSIIANIKKACLSNTQKPANSKIKANTSISKHIKSTHRDQNKTDNHQRNITMVTSKGDKVVLNFSFFKSSTKISKPSPQKKFKLKSSKKEINSHGSLHIKSVTQKIPRPKT